MNGERSGFRLAALAVGSLVASLLLAEGVCRWAGIGNPIRPVWEEERSAGRLSAYRPDSGLVYRYPDNPRGYFNELNEVWGTINAHGFRGTDRPFAKPAGVFRVAFLGDSFTLGIGVRDADTLPAQFERAIAATHPELEALNFGVSDTATPQQVALLERYVVSFEPDAVVVVVFLNDAGLRGTTEFLAGPDSFAAIRRRSYFANALFGSVERRRVHAEMIDHYRAGYADGQPGWEALKAALRRAHALSRSDDFELVVALYPVLFALDASYPFAGVHAAIARWCESEGIAFVDLLDGLRGQRDTGLWVHRGDQHPNERAHALAAAHLAGAFAKLAGIRRRFDARVQGP